MLEIIPIPAFKDNYIWLLHRHGHAIVVDPGDAAPVLAILESQHLQLDAILVTHHHPDHIGGVDTLIAATSAKVFAPGKGHYKFIHRPITHEEQLEFPEIELSLQVLEVPGHTLDHVAYYGRNMLFCGDTLFGAGCGRLFEGTPVQMFASLQALADLPINTQLYSAHEYTEHNLKFALSLEPEHPALLARQQQTRQLREQGHPSLPSTLGVELATNPFLRCHDPDLATAAGCKNTNAVSVFTIIREMRNHF